MRLLRCKKMSLNNANYLYFYRVNFMSNNLPMRVQRIEKEKIESISTGEVDLSLIQPIIDKYKSKKGNLIPILQGIQNVFGYVPREAFLKISEETENALSEMYGVATFYAQFRLNPVGKHIVKVCHGTACHVQSATELTEAIEDVLKIKDGETSKDKLFTLESVACLGCCSLAPVMMIGDETYGKLDAKKAAKVIKEIIRSEK